jgi:DNA-binding PadR family transcriptional regulator
MGTTALTEAVFYILLSLDKPLHGYGIMQNVEHLSGGRVRLGHALRRARNADRARLDRLAR